MNVDVFVYSYDLIFMVFFFDFFDFSAKRPNDSKVSDSLKPSKIPRPSTSRDHRELMKQTMEASSSSSSSSLHRSARLQRPGNSSARDTFKLLESLNSPINPITQQHLDFNLPLSPPISPTFTDGTHIMYTRAGVVGISTGVPANNPLRPLRYGYCDVVGLCQKSAAQ